MDDRKAMTAILYVLRTGCQWRALPRSLGERKLSFAHSGIEKRRPSSRSPHLLDTEFGTRWTRCISSVLHGFREMHPSLQTAFKASTSRIC